KGTAKTTAVRGLAALVPPSSGAAAGAGDGGRAPFVELPLGATEDRVVGSLDLHALADTGRPSFRPGLLGDAHGGILYVDEVNLLADHLVDVLLDAVASGSLTVERDGVSHPAPAHFAPNCWTALGSRWTSPARPMPPSAWRSSVGAVSTRPTRSRSATASPPPTSGWVRTWSPRAAAWRTSSCPTAR